MVIMVLENERLYEPFYWASKLASINHSTLLLTSVGSPHLVICCIKALRDYPDHPVKGLLFKTGEHTVSGTTR